MRFSLFVLGLLLSAPARADIPPPLLSFSGCSSYDLCTRCTWDYRQASQPPDSEACVSEARARGLELACHKRSGAMGIAYYCEPGLKKAFVASSGVHWLFALGAAIGVPVLGLLSWRRRRRR